MEILNKTPVMETAPQLEGLIGFLLFIGLILCVTCMIIELFSTNISYERILDIGIVIGFAILFIGIILCLARKDFGKPTGRFQYEVTIDNSVSFNEIADKYEIIDHRGTIYVLEDK